VASAGVQAFANGGAVETAIHDGLALKRKAIRPEPGLVTRQSDRSTTLAATASLQHDLLDAPAWASGVVGDLASTVREDCARAGGELLADVVARAGAEDRTQEEARSTGPPAIEDLAAEVGQQAQPAGEDPLHAAFRHVFAVHTPWSTHPASRPFAATEPVILSLQHALDATTERRLAAVVEAMARAEQWRLAAVRAWYPGGTDYEDLERIISTRTIPPPLARSFDVGAMGRAGASLALVVGQLEAHLVDHPLPGDLDVTIDTPLGSVVVSGRTTATDRTLAAPALVVDEGGNDTYRGVVAGPAMAAVPLSVLIDLGGDDTYLGGDTVATQGAGVFSFGFSLDRDGNDRYEAKDMAQGAGFLGVGLLYDESGDDVYQARTVAQGTGDLGLGVAVDLSGNDDWRITTSGQGAGHVRGVGVLLDSAGDDTYDADDTRITNPSSQSAQHNLSLAQGAGYGDRTGDPTTAMSGGIGFLVDLAGADSYSCGVFCQGAGYFFGQGILYDSGGDDTYRGVWYSQGSAAHFALGTLVDEAGDDRYETVMASARGAGHDESAGFLVEGGGNDRYAVAKRTNGASSDVGFGFFVDAAGADTYATPGSDGPGWYGQATIDSDFADYRGYEGARAVAVFVDMAGNDAYQGAPAGVANGADWKLPGWVSPWLGAVRMPATQVGFGRDLP